MALQFARKEVRDAKDQLEEGNVKAARQFVNNAKADVDDYADLSKTNPVMADKFEEAVEQFNSEAETYLDSIANRDNQLIALESTLDRIEDCLDQFAEDDV